MFLYFERSNGEKVLVKENIEERKILQEIRDHVAKLNPNFKIHYFRCWKIEEGMVYDVGSHTEFFIVTEKKRED